MAHSDTPSRIRNTNNSKKRIRARTFCWTVFDIGTEAQQKLKSFMNMHDAVHAAWQSEKCPETGNMHLQGCFHFKNPLDLVPLREKFQAHMGKKWHFNKAWKNVTAALKYSSKEATREGGVRFDMRNKKILIDDNEPCGTIEIYNPNQRPDFDDPRIHPINNEWFKYTKNRFDDFLKEKYGWEWL